jgi:probable phosphoglycerate mutase
MLLLIRHGESTFNQAERLSGRVETPLTELGQEQARRAGRVLGAVQELRASPLSRAVETAQLLGTGLEPIIDERLVELDFGVHDGANLSEVPAFLWEGYRDDANFAPVNGESLASLKIRVDALLEELFGEEGKGARRSDGDLVVVSHVSPIKAALLWALGLPPEATSRFHLSNASITSIGWGPHGPVVYGFNIVPS